MKALGIGCIWFAWRGHQNLSKFDARAHLRAIEAALESVDNVSAISIDHDHVAYTEFIFPRMEEDENFFPIFANLDISFNIYMPKRLQDQYLMGRPSTCEAEHFDVLIRYGYDMPVMYVTYNVDDPKYALAANSPSSAIVFIRKYLEEKLSGNSTIDFQVTGPSPLHVDIFLEQMNEIDFSGEEKFTDMSAPQAGYKRFLFEYKKIEEGEFDDESVLEKFASNHHVILGTFYYSENHRNSSLRNDVDISNLTRSLFQKDEGGWHKKIWARLKTRELIKNIYYYILEERLNSITATQYIHEKLRDGEISKDDPFYVFIERTSDEMSKLPFDEVKEVLKIFESRLQQYFGNASILIGGIAGGIIGALLTFALSQNVTLRADLKTPPTKIESKATEAPASSAGEKNDAKNYQ